jgi:hypothetical protein
VLCCQLASWETIPTTKQSLHQEKCLEYTKKYNVVIYTFANKKKFFPIYCLVIYLLIILTLKAIKTKIKHVKLLKGGGTNIVRNLGGLLLKFSEGDSHFVRHYRQLLILQLILQLDVFQLFSSFIVGNNMINDSLGGNHFNMLIKVYSMKVFCFAFPCRANIRYPGHKLIIHFSIESPDSFMMDLSFEVLHSCLSLCICMGILIFDS